MTSAQVLEAAAKRIEEKGLYRGHYNGEKDWKHIRSKDEAERVGPCDATMSLRAVGVFHDAAVDEAKELLRKEIGGGSISEWSDESTAEEVCATMRRVARKGMPDLSEVKF